MNRPYRLPIAVQGEVRRKLRAMATAAALACASLLGFLSNIATNGTFPRLPLSGIIAPARISELRFMTLLNKGHVSARQAEAARKSARGDPLAPEPFLYAAAAQFPDDRSIGTQQAARLLTAALQRDPRSRQARMLLLRRAVGTGQLDAAIDQLAVLNRLSPEETALLLKAVGRSIVTISQVDDVSAALARYPELFAEFIRGFNAAPKSTRVIMRLVDALPVSAITNVEIRSGLVTRLVANQAYPEARAVAGRGSRSVLGALLNDPTFINGKSNPPFGWEYFQNGTGVAERQGKGIVFVDYFGRRSGPLLRQLVTLAPGHYRIRLEGEAAEPGPASIALQVRCLDADSELVSLPLSPKRTGQIVVEDSFTVQSGSCRAQNVELGGLPQDQRREQQITVNRITLAKAR